MQNQKPPKNNLKILVLLLFAVACAFFLAGAAGITIAKGSAYLGLVMVALGLIVERWERL